MGPIHIFIVLLFLLSFLTGMHLITDWSVLNRVTSLRLFLSFVLPTLVVGYAIKKKNLSKSGAVCASFIGFVLTNFSYVHMVAMLVFFFTSSKLTKFRKEKKKNIESDYDAASQRDWQQVVANGGVVLMFALISILKLGLPSEKPIDLKNNFHASWYDLSIIGALSCAIGDTWSSEVGTAIGTPRPVLITTFKRVPAGVNGGVSFIGTIASLLGGFVLGLTYYASFWCFNSPFVWASSPSQLPVIFVAAFCSLFGSLCDSILGATLQFSGLDSKTNRVVQQPGVNVTKISGRNLLSNNSVNFLTCLITALIAPFFAEKYFT